jgi:hypothetical protein
MLFTAQCGNSIVLSARRTEPDGLWKTNPFASLHFNTMMTPVFGKEYGMERNVELFRLRCQDGTSRCPGSGREKEMKTNIEKQIKPKKCDPP